MAFGAVTDEGAEAAAADDKEPGVGVSVPEEEEGVSAESGGSAARGSAGKRTTEARKPGSEGQTRRERGTHRHRQVQKSGSDLFKSIPVNYRHMRIVLKYSAQINQL